MTPTLRLVSERDNAEPAPAVNAPSSADLAPVAQHLDQLQVEIDCLRQEINQLRRRDESLNFYMQRLDEELRLAAARLQQDFLPKSLPQLGTLHFHTMYRPAGYVSGDLYDVSRLDEAHVGFSIADAVGHGMPAALLTMFIKNALVTKQITPEGYRLLKPGEALSRLNDTLIEQNLSQATFATAVYGTINANTLICQYARAGHPYPILMHADGTTEDLEAQGGLLGIFPGEIFENGQAQLRPGDRLFIYSDGIEVAFADDQTLDTRLWRRELQRRSAMPTEQLINELSENLDRETGSLRPKDDLTMIVVEVK